MTKEEFFKIIGIVIVCFFIIFMSVKMFHLQTSIVEGLTNPGTTTTTTSPTNGEAGTAESYAAAINAQVVKLQDELLISKYRKDYESVIINLDDYISFLMIKQTLNMNIKDDASSNIDALNNLNTLNNAKSSLEATMSFLDKQ